MATKLDGQPGLQATNQQATGLAPHRPPVFLPRAEVERRVGLRRSAIYRRIRDKCFPQPVRDIGSETVWWLESEIEDWQRARIAAREAAEHGATDQPAEQKTGSTTQNRRAARMGKSMGRKGRS